MLVGAVQDTKRLGCEMYEVGGSVFLTTRRATPTQGEPVQGGLRVIVAQRIDCMCLLGGMAWSPRCVSEYLQMSRKLRVGCTWCAAMLQLGQPPEWTKNPSSRPSLPSTLHCHATWGEVHHSRGLQHPHIGSRKSGNDEQWSVVIGPHEYGPENDSCKELLSFLPTHQATVCNTWFEEKNMFVQTWQHPNSKQWRCIDFVIMRQRDKRKCLLMWLQGGELCATQITT